MAPTSTEILLLVMDIVLAVSVVYLLLKLRSKKKIEPEKEGRLADTPPRMTAPEAKLELLVPEEAVGEKPQHVELRTEAPKIEGLKEALSGNPGPGEGQDKAAGELELEDRAPEGRPVDAEPRISVENALKLEDELPEDPSFLSTEAEPGAVEPEKTGRTRKKSSRKKRAAKKEPGMTVQGAVPEEVKPVARKRGGRKKKIAAEEGQEAGGEAPKEVLTGGKTEEKTQEGIPESKPLF